MGLTLAARLEGESAFGDHHAFVGHERLTTAVPSSEGLCWSRASETTIEDAAEEFPVLVAEFGSAESLRAVGEAAARFEDFSPIRVKK